MKPHPGIDAARVIGEHVGSAVALGRNDVLEQLRRAVGHADKVDVFALLGSDGLPYRLIVRAFALVGSEPIGGTFIVDRHDVRRVGTDALIPMFPAAHRWVAVPLEGIVAMPPLVLQDLRARAPHLALTVRALQQAAS